MTTIALDIETIPTQNKEVRAEFQKQIDDALFGLEPPASYTKQKQVEWLEKKQAELNVPLDQYEPYRKLSFDGTSNHIISIGLSIGGQKQHFTVQSLDAIEEEKRILREFFDFIRSVQNDSKHRPLKFVGHNIVGFDLRVIKHRSMILGIMPPVSIPFNSKPWEDNPYDTMAQWDARNSVSMDKLARAFGLSGKGAMDGSMVYDMFLEEKFTEIGEYCADDADQALSIFNRMTFKELV